jgi:hypothetical protein
VPEPIAWSIEAGITPAAQLAMAGTPQIRNAAEITTTPATEASATCQRLSSQWTSPEPWRRPTTSRAASRAASTASLSCVSNTAPSAKLMRRAMLPMRSEISRSSKDAATGSGNP